jgi:hypothetical protein
MTGATNASGVSSNAVPSPTRLANAPSTALRVPAPTSGRADRCRAGVSGGARRPARVTPSAHPVGPQGRQAAPDVHRGVRVGVGTGGVVEDDAVPGGQNHFAHRHPKVGSRAGQVGLATPRRVVALPLRAVTTHRVHHDDHSLRRHYPVRFQRSAAPPRIHAALSAPCGGSSRVRHRRYDTPRRLATFRQNPGPASPSILNQ